MDVHQLLPHLMRWCQESLYRLAVAWTMRWNFMSLATKRGVAWLHEVIGPKQ